MTSYLCSVVTMGLSRTDSEIKGDIYKVFYPRVFNTPLMGFPWNIVTVVGV